MAKTKKEIYEKEILDIIKKNNLFVKTDIFAFYTGCTRKTFYDYKLHKSDIIKKALDDNKVKTKHSLKNKWFKSDNPTLQIALFKSICTKKERKRLNQSYHDHTTKGKALKLGVNFTERYED